MDREKFEKDVSEVLAFPENHYFEVSLKGAKIYAEAYKIELGDIVILYSHNTVIAVVSISEIIAVG